MNLRRAASVATKEWREIVRYASSVTRGEFLLGKLTPYVTIFVCNGLILWLLGITLFGAPFRGSLPLFLAGTTLFVIISSCIGATVAFLVRTQMAAMVISLFATVIAAAQYSGWTVPVSSMRPDGQVSGLHARRLMELRHSVTSRRCRMSRCGTGPDRD